MRHLRQTGRTTRLIEEAIRLHLEGKAVYIVVSNHREVERLRSSYPEILRCRGLKLETPASLGPEFCWKTLGVPGAYRNCVFLVDHHLLELRFAAVLEMLHRFDPPQEETHGLPGS